MDPFYLKLALVFITSALVFAFMMYKQKKDDEKAEEKFQDALRRIAEKYDKEKEDGK